MINDILLTSPDFIRSATQVSDNLQDKYIFESIREAQDIELQDVLGTNLLEALKNYVADNNIPGKYQVLLDKCQWFLCYLTVSNLVMATTYKINNIGLNTTTDDNVQILSVNGTLKLRDYYQKKADHYRLLLQNFLLDHRNDYPELNESQCHKIKSCLYSSASSNVFLGGKRGLRTAPQINFKSNNCK